MSQLDYGIIGNCQTSALIDTRGRIVWCCMPRFDSEAIFAGLVGGSGAGLWAIEPVTLPGQPPWEARQSYYRSSNVLVTTLTSPGGESQFELIDFMPRFEVDYGHYRPPQIMRIVRPVRGTPRIVVRCRPVAEYGRRATKGIPISSGVYYEGPESPLFLRTNASVTHILQESPFDLKESQHFVFSYGTPFQGPLKFAVEEQLDRTLAYWRTWVKHCNIPFEFQNEVIRSALVLKLHSFEDTGAIIAATTTSIPESPDGRRNWDYRYCWLRDAYFVISALNRLGQFEEMEKFIEYLQNVCASEPSGALQPVYGIGGEKDLEERELPWLEGFRGFGPVRIGNSAYKMDQHDVYGEMVLAITPIFFDKRLDRTDQAQALASVQRLLREAIRVFEQPDAGIWEFRTAKQHLVFSKVMSWAAVDRGIRIAGHIGRHDLVAEWSPVRDRMRAIIEKNAWNEEMGCFVQSFGGRSADAAVLLLPAINFVSYRDERFQKTLQTYETMLREGDGVYRYRGPDDFGVPKFAFTVCGFWMAEALWGAGRKADARELFSGLVRHSNHLGLLSEDLDPVSSELWGNFPQTYSHVGLINCAMKISQAWEDAF